MKESAFRHGKLGDTRADWPCNEFQPWRAARGKFRAREAWKRARYMQIALIYTVSGDCCLARLATASQIGERLGGPGGRARASIATLCERATRTVEPDDLWLCVPRYHLCFLPPDMRTCTRHRTNLDFNSFCRIRIFALLPAWNREFCVSSTAHARGRYLLLFASTTWQTSKSELSLVARCHEETVVEFSRC